MKNDIIKICVHFLIPIIFQDIMWTSCWMLPKICGLCLMSVSKNLTRKKIENVVGQIHVLQHISMAVAWFSQNLPKFSCSSETICLLFSLSNCIRHNCAPSYLTGASSSMFALSATLLGTHITALNTQERIMNNSLTFIFPNLRTGNKWFSQDHCHRFIR